MVLIGLSIGALIYAANVVSITRAYIAQSRRYFIALPIIPWVICTVSIMHADKSFGVKLMGLLFVTAVELFVDVWLMRLVEWTYLVRSPLHIAVKRNNMQRVRSLLESGVDADSRVLGRSALEVAIWENRCEAVDLLLSYGASLDSDPNSTWGEAKMDALGVAASAGHLEIVKQLVAHGASVNNEGGLGSDALHAAVTFKHIDVAEYLLKHGAACGTSSKTNFTALGVAIQQDSVEAVKLLLKYGADVSEKDMNGKTALDMNRQLALRHWKEIEEELTAH